MVKKFLDYDGLGKVADVIKDMIDGLNTKITELEDLTQSLRQDGYEVLLVRGLPAKDTLENMSWEDIAMVSEAGKAPEYFSVGDTKDIVVDDETLTLAIMGFNHDDKTDGTGKAGITFGLKNLMATTRSMNSSNTKVGGFTGSEMYTWLSGTLLPALPSDLQGVLKSVNKKTSAGGGSATVNTDAMKLFLFSEIEVFGSTTYSVAGEGEVYEYFSIAANRAKYLSNASGSAYHWWERSPHTSNSYNFCNVYDNGNAIYSSAINLRGVCFGFCV